MLALALPLAIAWLEPARSAAEPQATLSACADRVVNAARQQGARPSGPATIDFLLTGDRRTYAYRLPHDGCLGFLAVGHRQVQHLGLAIYAPSGRVLVHDQARDAHAYARFCGQGGRSFEIEVRMLDGEGEFHLVPLWNAPAELDALEPIMASCMHTGDPRPELIDVGPEPLGPPIDVELSAMSKRLGALGYKLEGGLLFGGLPERRREVRRVKLDSDQCYALAAIGDGDVEDIDLRLLSVADSASLVAADVTRRRDAVVKVCPEQSGTYVLDVRMYRGSGNYVVQSFNLQEPTHKPPAGVEGATRIPYAEIAAQLQARGMQPKPVSWGLLEPETRQTVPLRMRPGQCYAVAAVATADFGGGDLDMSLVDESGRVHAAEIGPNPHPLLFHCSEQGGLVRVVLEGHQIRRPSRFLLLLGEDSERPSPVDATVTAEAKR
jgi:hypothetical protein